MSTPTLAERISRKASAIVGANKLPQPEDPGALAKAEANLTAARAVLAKAHEAHLAAVAEATSTGDGANIRAKRRELEAAQGDHEIAAKVYEACKSAHDAGAAASDLAKRLAALERLQKARYELAGELDAAVAALGKKYAKRRQLDADLMALVPGNSELGHRLDYTLDAVFREQLAANGLPGQRTIRGDAFPTCSQIARDTGAIALAAIKGTPKAKPGA